MGLFKQLSGKHEIFYRLDVPNCPWVSFEEVAQPFFTACKNHGLQLTSEPEYIGVAWIADYQDGSHVQIWVSEGHCQIGLRREFDRDSYVSEPAFREKIRQVYSDTLAALVDRYGAFGYVGKIFDNQKTVDPRWNIQNINTSYM